MVIIVLLCVIFTKEEVLIQILGITMNKSFKTQISFLAAFIFMLTIPTAEAANNAFNLSDDKYQAIENKVQAMNYNQLIATRSSLIKEQERLYNDQGSTQSPSQNKAM